MLNEYKALLKQYMIIYKRCPQRPMSDFLFAIVISVALAASRLSFVGYAAVIIYVFTMPFTFLSTLRTMVGEIVSEKSSGIKEYLKLSGLSTLTYQFYAFTLVFVKVFFCTAFIIVGMLIGSVLKLGDDSGFFEELIGLGDTIQMYLLCSLATVSFILFLSAFFSEPKVASSVSGLIYVALSLASFGFLDNDGAPYYLMCLFPQSALILSLFAKENDWKDPSQSGSKIYNIRFILLGDFFLYLILYLYLDQIMGDENGVSKSIFFCLKSNKRAKRSVASSRDAVTNPLLVNDASGTGDAYNIDPSQDTSSAVYHEQIHGLQSLQRTVQINGLTKRFGDFTAVDKVSFSIYSGQIFCLLGHNGAGKTTAIKMLTGLIDLDGGNILYDGENLMDDFEQIRKKIGICAQHDILYDKLNVQEHLELIATMKRVPLDQIPNAIEETLQRMNLTDERNKLSEELSGGNKRKLSLAMAVIGGTKVVFLDEPTSGMDPQNRRVMWHTLKELKAQGMTILLTTHHLDEADELAERIAIMSRGKLLALGTSEFFKKNFGVGYYLTLTPIYNKISSADFGALKPQLSGIISQIIPQAKFDDQTASDVVKCSLPFSSQGNFPIVFAELEKIEAVRINVEMNTLEDVFVNIGLSEERLLQGQSADPTLTVSTNPPEALGMRPTYNFTSQTLAMCKRRFYILTRSKRDLFLMLLPLIMVILGSLATLGFKYAEDKVTIFTIVIVFSFSLNTAVYCSLPVYEREDKLKYLMDVMGLRGLPYWIGNLTVDFAVLTLINIAITGLYWILFSQLEGDEYHQFIPPQNFLLITVCYGYSLITIGYAWSFLFDKALSAVKYFPLINFFVLNTISSLLISQIEMRVDDDSTKQTLFLLVNLISPSTFYLQVLVGSTIDFQDKGLAYFALPYLGYGTFYFLITIFLEFRTLRFKPQNPGTGWVAAEPQAVPVDVNDVLFEKNRTLQAQNDPIRVENLAKVYDNGYTAVRESTFGVEEGQIFGLLGPNGAGKSTTFNIITAAIPKSQGSVKLLNTEVDRNMPHIYENVGICPQFNGLWNYLTVKEHLVLFGNLKGLSGAPLNDVVNYYLDVLSLREYENKKAGTLSGGNKRKLGVANAFIGSAYLLFLDEPSTGVDPLARRFLWNSIQQVLKMRKASVVLTTHSMYEAESLSHKIGILINGRFVCMGPTQYLKDKYSHGYKVTVALMHQAADPMGRVMEIFPQAMRQAEASEIQQTYNIPAQGFSFSGAFERLEELKQQGVIKDFSIYNTTLEQVFIYFSKFQINELGNAQ